MNLFFKKLFGRLQSTEKYEKLMDETASAVKRYRALEGSNEIKEYQLLKEEVTSPEFLARKKQYIKTKYKNTKQYQVMQDFKKLQNSSKLHTYLEVKDSEVLKDYLLFRNSVDYIKLSDKKLVAQSPDLKRLKDFETSKAYKTYLKVQHSSLPSEFARLQKEIADEAFQRENLFWSNPNRWQTTEDYKHEARYLQLADSPDIRFFFAQDVNKIHEYEKWKVTFAEEFDWKRLADSHWTPGFAYKNKAMKRVHSYVEEQQANNGGKNTGTTNGIMTLVTKEEKVTASAWDEKKGFVPKEFDYTSDVITTADYFRQEQGLFVIKLRCEGRINHAAWLGTDIPTPLLKLFHFNGKNIFVGSTTTSNGFVGEKVKGISAEDYYIYALDWNKDELIWFVNNVEVYRTKNTLPKEALYFAVSSFITAAQRAEEGKLEVDWIRVYTKK